MQLRLTVNGRDRTGLVLFLIALVLYLPAVGWGLPYATSEVGIRGWDVDSIAGMGPLSELYNLLIHPQQGWYLAYPLFHYLLLGAAYAPYLAYLSLTGGLTHPGPAYPYGFADPIRSIAMLALIARVLASFMAAGMVLAVYHTGRIVWDRATGILAALGVMLMGPVVYYSRTGNLDLPVLFWMALGLYVAARIVTSGMTVRRAIALGTLAAVAVATKDQAYGAWVPGLVLLVLLHVADRRRAPGGWDGWWKAPAALVVAGVVAYAIANGLVIRPSRFAGHLHFLLDFEHTFQNVVNFENVVRPETAHGYLLVAGDVARAVWESMGPVMLAAALAGIALTWRRQRFTWLLVAMALGYFVLVIAPIRHMQYRWAMFPALTLTLLAARALVLGWQRGGATRVLAGAVAAGAFAWLLAGAVDITYQMFFDARIAASRWLEASAHPGDRIAFYGSVGQLPRIPKGVDAVRIPTDAPAKQALADSSASYLLVIPDYSSKHGEDHSLYLPDSTYAALKNGSLGYVQVARFRTAPLFGFEMDYLPILNPPVQIYAPAPPVAGSSPPAGR